MAFTDQKKNFKSHGLLNNNTVCLGGGHFSNVSQAIASRQEFTCTHMQEAIQNELTQKFEIKF